MPDGTMRGRRFGRALRLTAVSVALVGTAAIARSELPLPPELQTTDARSDFGMVASGSPEATMAGVTILERGGNAIDAAVAAALMLGVSDPDASGLGGITYMLIHLAGGGTIAVDAPAVAPLAVDNGRLQVLKDSDAFDGYELATVPTTLAVLDHALRRFGTMDMATVLQPAIETAEHGYRLSALQIEWTLKYMVSIRASEYLKFIAMEDGSTLGRPGDLVCRPDLAATLRRIAAEGAASFYRGSIADEIAGDMVAHGGFLRKTDLARLRVRERLPLVTTYRGLTVSTFPRPGGGAAVTEMLNILEEFSSALLAADSVERHHLVLEASRFALVDSRRNPVSPEQTMWGEPVYLNKEHAAARARLITPGGTAASENLGPPPDPECEPVQGESTTQLSVVDREGNVVSLTQTLGSSFGAAVATPGLGFPYNSLLEAFNFDKPQCPGYLRRGSECSTDMAPTIVMDGDRLVAALGSPGSNRIPGIVATVISNMIDRRLTLREAIAAPRVLWGGITSLRPFVEIAPPITETDITALEKIGHSGMTALSFPPVISEFVKFGGVNAVSLDPTTGSFVGVADPRRGGLAEGPRVVATQKMTDHPHPQDPPTAASAIPVQ